MSLLQLLRTVNNKYKGVAEMRRLLYGKIGRNML